MLFSDI